VSTTLELDAHHKRVAAGSGHELLNVTVDPNHRRREAMFHTTQNYPAIVDATEIGPDPCRWASANAARIEEGSPIGAETLEELRSLYSRASVRHPWERANLLLIYNMLSAQARAASKGKRKIVAVMADPCVRPQHRMSSRSMDTRWSTAKKPASGRTVKECPALVDTT
jgi:hypothetical protein